MRAACAHAAIALVVAVVIAALYNSLVPIGFVSGLGLVLWLVFIVVLVEFGLWSHRQENVKQGE